jgi:hypothetical protein
MSRLGRALVLIALFAALTAVMTWPQARYLASRATPHHDVYFNMWRLRWVAHALASPRARLFDANIFYPERGTLALSDAMLVEGVAGAPLSWAGMGPVLEHNLLLLGAIALSGAAMFALARYLTGSRAAGILAGIVFAFAPYRFEHIMHMELQWTMWMPLAFLALHKTLDTGSWKYGLATGASVALQMLSSIYYGIFLATLLPLAAALLIARDARAPRRRALAALAAGGALAIAVTAIYERPYAATHRIVGDRPDAEISQFSAKPSSYRAATPTNWLYGGRFAAGVGGERRLFPGLVPIFLAIAGLLLRVPPARPIVYLLLLVAAFELSLGPRGYSYPFLYDHVAVYRSLRAMARLGIFVLLFLGVLAAYGYQALASGRARPIRIALAATLAAIVLAEYRVSLPLAEYPNAAPPVYRFLALLPRGVVAELPMPQPDTLPGRDAEYAYMSSFHWLPIVNGYSGSYPPSYLARLDQTRDFPDDRSLAQLRRDGVAYLVIHPAIYSPATWEALEARIDGNAAFTQLGRFDDADGTTLVYRLR